MGAAIFTGEGDIALIMVKAGLGVAALLILILSTVTTTFLDAYSAGISAESLSKKINGKYAALIVTVIGTVCAICFPMDDITNFLYLIGSVFAPMIAIQITDFFLLQARRRERQARCVQRRRLGAGLRALPRAHDRGHPGRQHPARHGRHDAPVPDRAQARPGQEPRLPEAFCENLPSRKRPHTVRAFLRVKQSFDTLKRDPLRWALV